MSVELYLAYVVACFVITIIPGPTVTLIVANGLSQSRDSTDAAGERRTAVLGRAEESLEQAGRDVADE